MPLLPSAMRLAGLLFWAGQTVNALKMPNATLPLARPESTALRTLSGLGVPRYRRKRHISARDMSALLDYHNHIRASVHPPAANMEYMVWDERLARSAEAWATQCIWAHGPSQLMRYVGQNLSIHSGRCSHPEPSPGAMQPRGTWAPCILIASSVFVRTQMVWASSSRLGCAIHTCSSINVWGSTWHQAVYLVCNYAIKGNWIGEAPYKMGRPCSACPASYQGICSSNMCFSGPKSNRFLWF
ncbi:PREDICTED: peptidase inhibitor R3HDML [Propithecus coquereli]|uniref:peptidase inhibitor R3HDML n=1 Tax=Propithecus coquereli TaxID=379532 RepID=UPI00063F7399|nr:PREDICTED: peptidase inhibitor R3HDML [Propithecus coquereli]